MPQPGPWAEATLGLLGLMRATAVPEMMVAN